MHQCCVFGCKNEGNHSFPKENHVRKRWEAATRCKDFRAKKHSKICSAHFKAEDYIETGKFSGLKNTRRILKKGIVPSIFPWNKTDDLKSKQRRERATARDAKRKLIFVDVEKRLKCNDISSSFPTTTTCFNTSEMPALDFAVDCVEEIVTQENDDNNPQLVQSHIPSVSDCSTQKNYQFYTIESFRNDDKGIAFYTGLESYNKFMFVFNTLCPEAYSITYKRSKVLGLCVEDQFFMTLMKLRRNKEDYELSRFFDVSPCTVSNICITWINFMHQMWSMLNIWPSRELVDFYMPEGFKKHYPSTRVIVDCTEIPIQRPQNPAAQRAAWSSYKNRSTVKYEVGASPSGLISHCSDAYAGSSSDRQIVERSELYQKCEKGDSIMADRGFNVQDIFAHKGVAVNIPSFFKGKCHLPGITVVGDRKLASKRIHIERLIGLTKTYCILQNTVNINYVPLMSKIYYVCVMMCNFRENIVKSTA